MLTLLLPLIACPLAAIVMNFWHTHLNRSVMMEGEGGRTSCLYCSATAGCLCRYGGWHLLYSGPAHHR